MADSEALTTLKSTIEKYLKESFGTYLKDQNDNYVLHAGSARVFIIPLNWVEGQTLIKIVAPVNWDAQPSDELARFLAVENMKLIFGKFSLDPNRRMVFFEHTLLGDFLNRKELEVAVKAIAVTADKYDDEIKAQFGGRKLGEQ
jgi:hypothetical protein